MFELTKYANGQQQQALELHRLRIEYEKLYAIYDTILPKALIANLLSREIDYYSDGKNAPMYTVEVFTKKEIDSEEAKMYIIQKTGMVPSIYDHGTHYVTNQKLTLEILKEISDCEDVLEVAGEYSGSCGSIGSVHERSEKYE
jgi:DNA-binding GntR family transcriptional regulator